MKHQVSSEFNASRLTPHEPARRSLGEGGSRPIHCLTFDVEEHFQVSAFDSPMRRRHWDSFRSRVERNTCKILELLAMREIRATFFVLGWVAERHPALVRSIAGAGHEVGSHGYGHELITAQTATSFREDVKRAKGLLEDLLGEPIFGYRAPSFTIVPETVWALSILVEEGYVYDSSMFPIHHDRYGMPGANPLCHQLATKAGPLWEVPPTTVTIGGIRVPVAGGGYLRISPFWLFRRLLKRAESEGRPLVMYLHPWELDPEQPKMRGPFESRFRHYVNLNKTESRLIQLIEEFRFAPIREVIEPINAMRQEVGAATRNGSVLYQGGRNAAYALVRG